VREQNPASRWDAYERSGSFAVKHPKSAVFPLLCPKAEEAWIPGWKCEVLHSRSGWNEPGAVFRTAGPFGAEVIWYTRTCDQAAGSVEFVNFGVGAFVFHFRIEVVETGGSCELHFSQTFVPVSEAGLSRVSALVSEDFQGRLLQLGSLIDTHLAGPTRP